MRRLQLLCRFLSLSLLTAAPGCRPAGDVTSNDPSAPRQMRAFLLANGFVQDSEHPERLTLAHVQLKDAAKRLGFSLPSLRPVFNRGFEEADHDLRTVVVRGRVFSVESDRGVPTGQPCPMFLADPSELCTLSISLTSRSVYIPPVPPRPTDSSPRLKIRSVALPKNGQRQFAVTFEIWADGTKPLVLTEPQIEACLSRASERVFRGTVDFPEDAFRMLLTATPGKPLVLTANVPGYPTTLEWSGFTPGVYSLRVIIAGDPGMKGQLYDYMWLGGKPGKCEVSSDDFEIRIPDSAAARGAAPGEREMGHH